MEYKKSQSLSEQAADEILDMITIKNNLKWGTNCLMKQSYHLF